MSNDIKDILYWITPNNTIEAPPTRKQIANKKRRDTRAITNEKHASMRLIVRELKLRPGSGLKHEYLRRLFTEAKWCYNWYLDQYNNGKPISKIKDSDEFVVVMTPGGYESRRIVALSSQMRQQLRLQLGANLKSLFTNIERGNVTHGTLRYKSSVNQIPLKAGKWASSDSGTAVTFTLNDKRSRVRFQGADFLIKVTGGDQIPEGAEIACGKLVRRCGDYFLQVTFYVPWDKPAKEREAELLEAADGLVGVGFDFGIDRQVVDSFGHEWGWCFEESDRYKAAQRANEVYRRGHRRGCGWMRSSKRQLRVMELERERLRCRKKCAVDRFVGMVRSLGPGVVGVQDEQLAVWASDERYSGVVHHSVLGGIIARLKSEPSTLLVSKWCRTTGVCPECGHVLPERLGIDVREWDCPVCRAHHDRDEASARVILLLACIIALYPNCPTSMEQEVFDNLVPVLMGCGALTLIRT